MIVVSRPKVSCPGLLVRDCLKNSSNQYFGMYSTLIFLISSLNLDSTTTLKLYFPCFNFSSTSPIFSQDFSATFTSSHSFLLQHYFFLREIQLRNFEMEF